MDTNHVNDLATINDGGLNKYDCVRYVVKYHKAGYKYGHQICYGGLGMMPKLGMEYIVNGIQHESHEFKSVGIENHRVYLSWLMHESPYKDGFLETDVDWSLENNCTYHSVDQSGNYVLACLTAVRAMSESVSCPGYKHFVPLIEAGCSKELAFIFCFHLQQSERGLLKFYELRANGGHTAWGERTASVETVCRFISNKKVGIGKPFNTGETRGVQTLFDLFGLYDTDSYPKVENTFQRWVLNNCEASITTPIIKNDWGDTRGGNKELNLPAKDMYAQLAKISDKFYKEYVK